jgi:ribosome maturation factor RimP
MLGEELRSLIDELVREPLFLVDTELGGDGKGRVLRVVVDTDSGVKVDELGRLNRELGRRLDEGDWLAGAYRLEVCSPGLDRPLRHPRVLARAVGRKVLVRLADAEPDGRAEWTGRLVGSDEAEIRVEVDGEVLTLAWGRVQSVHHVLEW